MGRSPVWLCFLAACTARSDLFVGASHGDPCLANADCPEACVGGRCVEYASGGEVCDDPEDCADSAHICPIGLCVETDLCGNAVRESGEVCDDGNASSGDGCSASCEPEVGWQCIDETPGRCFVEPGPGFVLVPPATFSMGSPTDEAGRQSDETRHEVTLTRAYWAQTTEVTQGAFEAVMGWNPSRFGACNACPVETVTWFDALAYTNVLSESQGLAPCYALSDVVCESTAVVADYTDCTNDTHRGIGSASVAVIASTPYECEGYRLPTEAEWELAARAGDARATYNGEIDSGSLDCQNPNTTLDPIAWFCGNDNVSTMPVAQLRANDWGLYDALGNVWEWCWDWNDTYLGDAEDPIGPADGAWRVARGGSWDGFAWATRAAYRGIGNPLNGSPRLGIRLVKTAR
ncbi:SUMF1/EgtB/PvdO family nonheme iron enzyme [Myxococcota bacterium]